MNMKEIQIRKAERGDAELIADVVGMALDYEPKQHPLHPVFLELAGREVAQYSYRNALVAEVNGVAVGAIVGYDGARLHELRQPIYPLIRQHLGKEIEIEEETSAEEFYIDSVAVLLGYRSLGIGRQLLEKMRDKAFGEGHSRVGLLVDMENPRAEKLYRSLGFERVNPTTFLGHPMWHLQVVKK